MLGVFKKEQSNKYEYIITWLKKISVYKVIDLVTAKTHSVWTSRSLTPQHNTIPH